MRNAQTGAPELVARIQTQKRTRRAEVEWPTRSTKAKRSRGLMAGLNFGENAKFFCARLARARAGRAGGGEGRLGRFERLRRGPRRQRHLIAATSPVRNEAGRWQTLSVVEQSLPGSDRISSRATRLDDLNHTPLIVALQHDDRTPPPPAAKISNSTVDRREPSEPPPLDVASDGHQILYTLVLSISQRPE